MEFMSREDYCEETCGKENREGYKTCKNCGMLNVPTTDVQPVNHRHLRWDSHKGHWELLKEFYYLNKYLITEQLKDTLLDAIECMEYTMTEEDENYKEEGIKYHMPKDGDEK